VVVVKNYISWDMTMCSPSKVSQLSEESVASIFMSINKNLILNVNRIISSACCSTTLHNMNVCPFFLHNILKKRPKNGIDITLCINSLFKEYRPCYSCSSNGTQHTNLLILKGYFKSLSQINTVPIPVVLSTDIPT
jgi:hypothetical protein